ARQMLRLPLDDLAGPLLFGVGGADELEHLGGGADGREWVAQFVREHGQEFVLAAGGIVQGFFSPLGLSDVPRYAVAASRRALRVIKRPANGANPFFLPSGREGAVFDLVLRPVGN